MVKISEIPTEAKREARKKAIQIKVYGVARERMGEKRVLRKGKYFSVARDKKGRFVSCRKWSPKRPNVKEYRKYVEEFREATTGREARQTVAEEYEKYPEWVDFEVET